MTCPTIRNWIQESLDRPLDEAARRAVERHLAACEFCRAYRAELQALNAGLAAMPRVQAPAALLANLDLAPSHPRRRVAPWAWSTAAAVLVLVGLWRLHPIHRPSPPAAHTVAAADAVTPDPILGWLDPEPSSGLDDLDLPTDD
jgi:anti-sigma factor RsiW